jgi:hypothetical protein
MFHQAHLHPYTSISKVSTMVIVKLRIQPSSFSYLYLYLFLFFFLFLFVFPFLWKVQIFTWTLYSKLCFIKRVSQQQKD